MVLVGLMAILPLLPSSLTVKEVMPIYEYKCGCENEREVLLSFQDTRPQICKCGKVMQRKMSTCSFVMKQTGNQMALDTLNDKGNGMPNRHWKADAERFASAGL